MASSKAMSGVVDMTTENITNNTILANTGNPDARMKFNLERLVVHLHQFARETRLSTSEWEEGIKFLTEVGKTCTDVRQEMILLSDVLGLSLLVDSIDHPKCPAATEGTVLGPFHTDDAEMISHGQEICRDTNGEPLLVVCSIMDTAGNPIPGVKVDIWETDSSGHYDVQHADLSRPDGRCLIESDSAGVFWFKGILPVSYPIPSDGPVGRLLTKLHRHPYRPAHMHFMMEKPGYDRLITEIYLRQDPYISSDAVFGVKNSLIVDHVPVDPKAASIYSVDVDRYRMITYDFTLMSIEEAEELRQRKGADSLESLGLECHWQDGLPVPDID